MRGYAWVLVAALAAGCNGDDTDKASDTEDVTTSDTESSTDTEDTETDGYPSSYEGGKYRLSTFSLNEDGDGDDLNGDGEADNNLPTVLNLVDAAVSDADLSRDGLNEQISEAIASDELVMLLDFDNSAALQLDILGGSVDTAGAISVSEGSYDDGGDPLSRLTGSMSAEAEFEVGPGDVTLPVPFFEDTDPYLVPVENAGVSGSVDAKASAGLVVGVIPSDRLLDEVILPLMTDLGFSEEEIADYEETLVNLLALESMSDIELDGDRRGVSCAFTYTAEAATW